MSHVAEESYARPRTPGTGDSLLAALDGYHSDLHLSAMRLTLGTACRAMLLTATAACGSDPNAYGRCSELSLTVLYNPVQFHWEPEGCSVHTLTVTQSDAVKWYVFMQEATNGLKSPIRYGVTPVGALASGADSLTGGPYLVEIVRLDEYPDVTVSRTSFNAP